MCDASRQLAHGVHLLRLAELLLQLPLFGNVAGCADHSDQLTRLIVEPTAVRFQVMDTAIAPDDTKRRNARRALRGASLHLGDCRLAVFRMHHCGGRFKRAPECARRQAKHGINIFVPDHEILASVPRPDAGSRSLQRQVELLLRITRLDLLAPPFSEFPLQFFNVPSVLVEASGERAQNTGQVFLFLREFLGAQLVKQA